MHRRYDKSAIGDVEKALMMSDLGMTPQNDGKLIRLNVPQLTEDRRKVTCRSLRPRAVLRVLTRRAAARRSSLSLPRASGRRARWRSATSAATPSTRSKSWRRCAHARTHARPLTALAARRLTRARAAQAGMGEDESKDLQEEVQKSLKKFEGEIESLVTQRDKEIMTL